MQLSSETKHIQSELANYCRTNEFPHLAGAKKHGLEQYRRLVYNIIDDTLDSSFPITRKLLSDNEWNNLIDRFLIEHKCSTPSIWKMPLEFYSYFTEKEKKLQKKYPFLKNLLYFEWLEIELDTMPDEPIPAHNSKGSWFKNQIIINPEFKIIELKYPVHQYSPLELKVNSRRGLYFLLIYRIQENGKVKFYDLSPLYVALISKLQEEPSILLKEQLQSICELFNVPYSSEVENHVVGFLEKLKQDFFILGFN